MESKIIQFDPSKIPATPKRSADYCRHLYVEVCEKTRMIICSKCEQVIDPFDYMWSWANRDYNLQWTRNDLQEQIKKLSADLKELKREERNARSRVKRLIGK